MNTVIQKSLYFSENSSPSIARRQLQTDTQDKETGVVLRHAKDKTYGFIKPDRTSIGKDIFFHLKCLVVKGPLPDIGQRVQFSIVETPKGLQANRVSVEEEVSDY